MTTRFRTQFLKDLRKLKNKTLKEQVLELIVEIEGKSHLQEISRVKKLKGHKANYRVRIGDFRIGISELESDIWFERILHRKDIYKKFP